MFCKKLRNAIFLQNIHVVLIVLPQKKHFRHFRWPVQHKMATTDLYTQEAHYKFVEKYPSIGSLWRDHRSMDC